MNRVREISGKDWGGLSDQFVALFEPVVIRALVEHWPVVKSFDESGEQGLNYVRRFANDRPVTVYVGEPEISGRFGYSDELTQLNFKSGRIPLEKVLDRLISQQDDAEPAAVYVGSSPVDLWLPDFSRENHIQKRNPETVESFWLGSKTVIAPHFDFPHNLICVVGGRRKVTLFPPDQLANLYVGPLDLTPAGQPISTVDLSRPNLGQHPKFGLAQKVGLETELGPGDALFIPSMWWHQVESLDAINMMVNLWWTESSGYLGSPLNALMHTLLAIRDIPQEQKEHWKRLFDYYVFEMDVNEFDHIPEKAKGILAPLTEKTADTLKARVIKELSQL